MEGKEYFERNDGSPATRFACSSELIMSVSCPVYAVTKREVLHSSALDGMISTTSLLHYWLQDLQFSQPFSEREFQQVRSKLHCSDV